MRILSTGIFIGALAIGMMSCKSSTSPTDEGSLSVESTVSTSTVNSMSMKGDRVEAATIDSVKIQRVRLLISRIKLQRSDEDTVDGGRDVKAGPGVVTFENGKLNTAFSSTVPVGRYDRLKIEVRPFSPSEAKSYESDPIYEDFAAIGRPSFIVEGTVWSSGVPESFTQTSDNVENLWVKVEPYFEVSKSTTTKLKFDFDAVTWLKVGGSVKDPRDGTIRDDLKKRLKNFFKLLRK